MTHYPMKNRQCYAVIDPLHGRTLWWTALDAERVARHRTHPCTVEETTAQPGDVVSRLGAPDTRIPKEAQ